MAVAWLATLTVFSVLALESRGQLAGAVGNPCQPGNRCLDTGNNVCDTNASPPVCRIKATRNCARQPNLCVTMANCISDRCVCQTQALDTGLCLTTAVTTESAPSTTIAATVMTTTPDQSDNNVTVTVTQPPVTTTTTANPSGAVTWTSRGLNHVTQLMAIILLCLLLS